MRFLSFSHHYFGVLFLDDKFTRPPFDTLITDIQEGDLHNDISRRLKKKYLSPLL